VEYLVRPGDTLPRIARDHYGDETLWPEIARTNLLEPPYRLFIGQGLFVPTGCGFETGLHCFGVGSDTGSGARTSFFDHGRVELASDEHSGAATVLARGALFVLADEVLPSRKVVRKVLVGAISDPAAYVAAHPEVFGLRPLAPGSSVSLGEHALGNNRSRFTSASTLPRGAPNIAGRPVYIDVARARAAGVAIHSSETIVADLARLAAERPHLAQRVQKLSRVILEVEREVLLEGAVLPSSIKSSSSMSVTRGLRVVQVVGVAFTAYDLGNATIKSVKTESAAPIVAESIRQVGGWGAAWLGAKTGAALGLALGIETGPGAILTGAAGALIFGTVGYFSFDWLADKVDAN
jgi:hypothetical protein